MASFEAIEHRHAQVVIYQDEAKRLSALPQFGFVDERNREQRKMWVDVLKQGVAEGSSGPTSTSTSCTGSSATPPGSRSAGISRAGRSPPNRSAGNTSHRPRRNHRRRTREEKTEMAMSEAYIVGAVRTPVGKRNGGAGGVHPADLGAHVLTRAGRPDRRRPGAVEDVIMGCVDAVGAAGWQHRATAWLAAGLPEEVPGVTIDRQCGSSQQAIHFAAQAVLSGTQDLVVAGGVQNMSLVPIASAMVAASSGFPSPVRRRRAGRTGTATRRSPSSAARS